MCTPMFSCLVGSARIKCISYHKRQKKLSMLRFVVSQYNTGLLHVHCELQQWQLFQIFTQSLDAIDVTSVTLSRLYSINAIDVTRVTRECRMLNVYWSIGPLVRWSIGHFFRSVPPELLRSFFWFLQV